MSRISVPIGLQKDLKAEVAVAYLQKIGCDRVFLAIPTRPLVRDDEYFDLLDLTRRQLEYFRNAGFEAGIWLTTIGYGGPVLKRNREISDRMTHLRSITGQVAADAICPLDDQFVNHICTVLQDFASLQPDLLMLDDELCLSVRPGIGCACEKHLAEYRRLLRENVTLEELPDKLFTGGRNRYRDIWLNLMGDTLRNFCRSLREAVDGVNLYLRMVFCTGYTSRELEEVDAPN